VLTVREEEPARLALDLAVQRWRRTNDAWEALTWVLAHDALIGTPVTESGKTRTFTYIGARSIDMPTITVLYEITAECITIHDAKFREATHAQAGRS
jgi:hypothetical protein